MSRKIIYNNVDDLPTLTPEKDTPTFKSVDELPDLKKKESGDVSLKTSPLQSNFTSPLISAPKSTVDDLTPTEKEEVRGKGLFTAPPEDRDKLVQQTIEERKNPAINYGRSVKTVQNDLSKIPIIPSNYANAVAGNGDKLLPNGKLPISDYLNNRTSQIDGQITELQNKIHQAEIYNSSSAAIRSHEKKDTSQWQTQINELNKYKTDLHQSGTVMATKQAVAAVPYPTVKTPENLSKYYQAIGRKVDQSKDDIKVTKEEDNIKTGNNKNRDREIVAAENLNREANGLEYAKHAADIDVHSGTITPEQYDERIQEINGQQKELLNNHPEAKKAVYSQAVGQIIAQNRNAENKSLNALNKSGDLNSLWQNVVNWGATSDEVKRAFETLEKNGAQIDPAIKEYLIQHPDKTAGTSTLGNIYNTVITQTDQDIKDLTGRDDNSSESERFQREKNFINLPHQELKQPESIIATKGENILRPIENPDAGKYNGYGIANAMGNTAGTVLKYALLTKGLGAVADTALGGIAGAETAGYANEANKIKELTQLTADQKNLIGTYGASVLIGHHGNLEAAKQFTNDPQEQKAYAGIMDVVNTLVFTKINPSGIIDKIAGANKGLEKTFLDATAEEGAKALNKETAFNFIKDAVVGTAKNLGHTIPLLEANELAQLGVQALFNPQSVKDIDVGKRIKDTAIESLIAFSPISALTVFSEAHEALGQREAIRASAYEIAKDPQHFEEFVNEQVDNGKMDRQDADQKISIIRGLNKEVVNNEVPEPVQEAQTEPVQNVPEQKAVTPPDNFPPEAPLKTEPNEETKTTEIHNPETDEGSPVTEPVKVGEETEEGTGSEEKVTGIKNNQTLSERKLKGFEGVELTAKRTFGDVFEKGKNMVDNGDINPRALAKELSNKPRALQPEESAALVYDRMRISNEYDKVSKEILKAKKDGDEIREMGMKHQLDSIQIDMKFNDEAARRTGYEQGLGLAARKMLIKQDYSMAAIMQKAKVAAKDGEVPQDVQEKLQSLKDQLDEANEKILKHEERIKELELEKEKRKSGKGKTKEQYKVERDNIISNIKDKWKSTGKDTLAVSVPYAQQLIAIAPDVAKLVKSYAQEGVAKLEEIIDKIHEDLSPHIPDIQKEEIKGMILGDYKKDKTAKVLTKEQITANANYEKIKNQIDKEIEILRLKDRGYVEKGLDYLHGWHRFALLSGIPTLGKIGGAVVGREVTTRAEDLIGKGLSYLPGISTIAKGAPRHGSMSIKAETEAFSTWVEKMTYSNIIEIMKGKGDELDALYGDKKDFANKVPQWMEFWGQLHQSMKSIPKRVEFNRSVQVRTEHALKNGKDIHKPEIQMDIATGAYNDALSAVFMQDNVITDAYKQGVNFLKEHEARGVADALEFMFPIIKVPTNYVFEQSSYLIGGLKAAWMLRKGVERLTPSQKDFVLKAIKKQVLGAAFMALGYYNPQAFGGYYTGKRKEGDLDAGDIRLFGVTLPHWLSHTPLLEVLQFGATLRRVNEANREKTGGVDILDAVVKSSGGVIKQIPFLNSSGHNNPLSGSEGFKDFIFKTGQGVAIPQFLRNIADASDVKGGGFHPFGETIERKPKTFMEYIEKSIPGLRKNVPEKQHNYINVYNPRTNTKRQASKEEQLKYENVKDELYRSGVDKLPETKIYVDRYGDVTFEKTKKTKNYNDLTDKQLEKLKISLKDRSSREAKEKLFGKGQK